MADRRRLPYLQRGHLDQMITVQRPVYNARGDQIESWDDVATIYAAFEPSAAGLDQSDADRTVNRQQVVFRFDFDPFYTTPMRISHLSTVYNIVSLVDLNGARIQMVARGEAVL